MKHGTNTEADGGNLSLVMLFTFIVCLGSVMMGFTSGYATQTLIDLSSTNGTASISFSDTAETAVFNVSHTRYIRKLQYWYYTSFPSNLQLRACFLLER